MFQFIIKVLDGFEIRPVKFFHAKLGKPLFYEAGFVHGDSVMVSQETAFPSVELRGPNHRDQTVSSDKD